MISIYTVESSTNFNEISVYKLNNLIKYWGGEVKGTGRKGRILKADLCKTLYNNKRYMADKTRISIGQYMSTPFWIESKSLSLIVKEKSPKYNFEQYELPLPKDKNYLEYRGHPVKDGKQILEYCINAKKWFLNGREIFNRTLINNLNELRKSITYIDIFYVFVKLRFLYQNLDINQDLLNYSIQHYFTFFDQELLKMIKII